MGGFNAALFRTDFHFITSASNVTIANPAIFCVLNKPKNVITTLKDENNRKTVLDFVSELTKERIYPIGRLDRNTTGLLLLTNDGRFAQKLSHPSFEV